MDVRSGHNFGNCSQCRRDGKGGYRVVGSMSVVEEPPYDPIGFKGRFKRAFLMLGVPILLAAVLPAAYAIIGAWVLVPVVALVDLLTVIRRNQEGRPYSGGGKFAGLFGGGRLKRR
jgi:phosphatidylglycerophosphate synthase